MRFKLTEKKLNKDTMEVETVDTDWKFSRTLLVEKEYRDATGEDLSEQIGFIWQTLVDSENEKDADLAAEANEIMGALRWHENIVELLSWMYYETDGGKIVQNEKTRAKFVDKFEDQEKVTLGEILRAMFRKQRG